jgi:hypothetical protein
MASAGKEATSAKGVSLKNAITIGVEALIEEMDEKGMEAFVEYVTSDRVLLQEETIPC